MSSGANVYTDKERFDALAAIQHEIWAENIRTLFGYGTVVERTGDIAIPAQLVAFALERATLPFADLDAHDQATCRAEVQRFAPLIGR
jgi:hypothetical protein